jgi:nucleotide-binding universal stress UspA family protein
VCADDLDALGLPPAADQAAVRARLQELLAEGGVQVSPEQLQLTHQAPAAGLRAVLRDGDLLVVGTRGRAGRFPAGLASTSGRLLATTPRLVALVP